jgi:serine/threonine protein phosphatase 1
MLRVYAIGDIHGLLQALYRLIAECERDADGRPMMGNHEALALSAIDDLGTENWISNGGDMALRRYDVSSIVQLPAANVAWLRSLPLAFDDGLRFFVHAGINPAKPLDRQDRHDLLWISEPFLSTQQDYGRLIDHSDASIRSEERRGRRRLERILITEPSFAIA